MRKDYLIHFPANFFFFSNSKQYWWFLTWPTQNFAQSGVVSFFFLSLPLAPSKVVFQCRRTSECTSVELLSRSLSSFSLNSQIKEDCPSLSCFESTVFQQVNTLTSSVADNSNNGWSVGSVFFIAWIQKHLTKCFYVFWGNWTVTKTSTVKTSTSQGSKSHPI